MKKILCTLLALITVLSLCLPASAVSPESPQPRFNSTNVIIPAMWFSGSNAVCKLQVVANEDDASIRATVKLTDSRGNPVTAWNITGTGVLNWRNSYPVSSGTYTMTVYVQVYHPDTGSDYYSDTYTGTL